MPLGGGEYEEEANLVRTMTEAHAIILGVILGDRGSGFTIQSDGTISRDALADVLEGIVKEIRKDENL